MLDTWAAANGKEGGSDGAPVLERHTLHCGRRRIDRRRYRSPSLLLFLHIYLPQLRPFAKVYIALFAGFWWLDVCFEHMANAFFRD